MIYNKYKQLNPINSRIETLKINRNEYVSTNLLTVVDRCTQSGERSKSKSYVCLYYNVFLYAVFLAGPIKLVPEIK